MVSSPFLLLFLCAAALVCGARCGTTVDRLRGIPLNSKFLYKEGKDFTCLDGSLTISFDWVNDDYCDCPDGSDEPGTSACPRSSFHCANLGASPMNIPSSRVNDLICDCCDGSDEWAGRVRCPNLCEELGRRMKAELAEKVALHREGYATRLKMVDEAKKERQEKQSALEKLEAELGGLSALLEEAKAKMDEAVQLETAAKNAETAAWEETRNAERAAERREEAEAAFKDLDTNNDNKITVDELQSRREFDLNSDGVVATEEAMDLLGNVSEANADHFVNDVWQRIEHRYKTGGYGEVAEDEAHASSEAQYDVGRSFDSKEAESGSKASTEAAEEMESHVAGVVEMPEHEEPTSSPSVGSMESPERRSTSADESVERWPIREMRHTLGADHHVTFTNETQALMSAADEARNKYHEILDNKATIERDIKDIKALLSIDFGPDSALLPLHKECFEVKDTQYTYKLCLFDEAFQISLNDGHRISLGRWGKWIESSSTGVRKQLYENGQSCWNGPMRTTTVVMECGSDSALRSATEPSMCEYTLTFRTPAVCEPPESIHPEHEL
uniref:Glucosidase 2 subunit beta n=1 Tax=Trichuris muris TaxID=70415 RepID=A0A5S6QRP4_TRIMR